MVGSYFISLCSPAPSAPLLPSLNLAKHFGITELVFIYSATRHNKKPTAT